MQEHLNAMRRETARMMANLAQPRMGLITSYNPEAAEVKVRLQPEGYETGWMPLGSIGIGNGWGVMIGPNIGDQVTVIFQEGNGGSPVALLGVYSDEDRPVVDGIGGCPSGEMWFVHKSGARLRFLNDGTIEIRRSEGVQAKLNPDGTIDLNAGTILIGAEGANFLPLITQAFQAIYNSHTHGQSPPPLPQMTTAHMTTALKGA